MRTLLSIATLALCALPAAAEDIYQYGSTAADAYTMAAQIESGVYEEDYYSSGGCGDCCDPCGNAHGCGLFGHGKHGCGLFGHGKHGCHGAGRKRFQNLWENCNCNGSYKFPVPPLYTYHWPGLYSWQLMTDYQSPWRYPAIKPYTDENLPPAAIVPASFVSGGKAAAGPTSSGGVESVADKMRRVYGQ